MDTQDLTTIRLGGKFRKLRYTLKERRIVESEFPRADGRPGRLSELVNECDPKRPIEGSADVQLALLWGALLHQDEALQKETVEQWLVKYVEDGGRIGDVWLGVRLSVLRDGALFVKWSPPEKKAECEGEGEATDPNSSAS